MQQLHMAVCKPNFEIKAQKARHKRNEFRTKNYCLKFLLFLGAIASTHYLRDRSNLGGAEFLLTLITPFLWVISLSYILSPFGDYKTRKFETRREILSQVSLAGLLSISLLVSYNIVSWLFYSFDDTYRANFLKKSLSFTVTNSYGKEIGQENEVFEWINPEYNESQILIKAKEIRNPLIARRTRTIKIDLKLPPCSSGSKFNLFDGEESKDIFLSPKNPVLALTENIQPNDYLRFVVSDLSGSCKVTGDNREFALGIWEPDVVQ